jgi:phosphoribosylglycinamide formyltransferase 1
VSDVEHQNRPRLGILISGRGSNLRAIADAIDAGSLMARISVVISNRSGAAGLAFARDRGIDTIVIDHRDRAFVDRRAFDSRIARELDERRVDLVCLAGFMRLLGPAFLEVFPDRVLNIHPSLLPAFPGMNAQRQALEHGVLVTGATVHFVTADLDGGPIVIQAAVPVLPGDSVDTLSARILVEEHRIYPQAIRMVLAGGWRIDGRRFIAGESSRESGTRTDKLPMPHSEH